MSDFSSDHSSEGPPFPLVSKSGVNGGNSAPWETPAREEGEQDRSVNRTGGRLGVYLGSVFFIVALIPLVLIFSIQYRELCRTRVSGLQKSLILASRSLKNDMELIISHGFEFLNHLASHMDLADWLEAREGSSGPVTLDEPVLESITHDAAVFGLESILVADVSGHILLDWPGTEDGSNPILFGPFKRQDWANIAAKMFETRGRFISPPLAESPGNENTFAYMCLPVKNNRGKTLGTITAGIKRSLVARTIGNHSAFLYPGLEQEVLNNDFQKTMNFNDLGSLDGASVETRGRSTREKDEWGQGVLILHDKQGHGYVGIREKLKTSLTLDTPWYVQTVVPLAPIYAERAAFKKRAVLFTAVSLGFSMLIAWMLSHGTSRMIRQYLIWARHMARGNVMPLSRPRGDHEIAELGKELSDFSHRMTKLVRFASSASGGDFSRTFPILGHRDELGRSINGIRDYFQSILVKIRSISDGKYSQDIPDGLPNDELSPKLKKLAEALNRMNEDNMRQITATLAQVELVRKISENRILDDMIDHVLSFFCQYLKAGIGVFFVQDPETEAYIRAGSYGALDNDFPQQLKPGEGLCGQAVIEKKPLMVASERAKVTRFTSGLARKPARSILAFPFVLRDEVIGVMELGSIDELKADYLDFITQNSESIAIGIHSAMARKLTESLLVKTMEQSKRLTAHQDELSLANRELADQAEALKKSESRLLAREEELKKANQDLEARSHQLEEQKNFLDQKNRELVETKSILELKADELARSNRYKSEFLANMSHELRTPLNSIILLSKLLGDKLEGIKDDQNSKFAHIINTSGKELLNLIDEVLDLTRVTSGDMEVAPVRYELYDIAKVMGFWYDKHITDKSVTFDVKLGSHLPDDIVTDPQKLERILKCLMSNAFKYTEKGSVVMEIKRPSPELDLPGIGLAHENTVEFSIIDTGQGIPEDKQTLVFEAFRQVDGSITRKHGGTGLGLSLAQEFARLLGGEIMLVHSSEKGSTFSLFLPDMPFETVEPEK